MLCRYAVKRLLTLTAASLLLVGAVVESPPGVMVVTPVTTLLDPAVASSLDVCPPGVVSSSTLTQIEQVI